MKHLLVTTAFVALTTVPLHAGTDTEAATEQPAEMTFAMDDSQFNLSNLLGARVYIETPGETTEEATGELTEPRDSWEDIGEIGEAFFDDSGEIDAMIVDVGGFLGIGEHHVEVTPADIAIIPDADDEGQFFVIYNGARADIEGKEAYDFETAEADGLISAREKMANVSAEDALKSKADTSTADGDDTAATDADTVAPTTDFGDDITMLTATDIDALKAEDLQGLAVYDAKSEHVGEISELILTGEGKVSKVIVDVGGFLGIGEKPVAMNFDEIDIMRFKSDENLAAKVSVTIDDLKAMEAWDG